MAYTCLVCGYPNLGQDTEISHELCPSCGFEYGYDDRDIGISYEEYRTQWMARGMPWRNAHVPIPQNWNPRQQLLNIGVRV